MKYTQIPNNVYMLDLETRGTKPGCAIGSIGCVRMCDNASFYVRLDWPEQPNWTQDTATLLWWEKQSQEVYREAMTGDEDNLAALVGLGGFLHAHSMNPVIWAKGIDFDPPILADLYHRMKLPIPWKYNNVRDFRTVKKIFDWKSKPRSPSEMHNALFDAQTQAEELLAIAQAYPLQLD